MASAVPLEATPETTDIPLIVRCSIILGVIQSVIVLLVVGGYLLLRVPEPQG